MKAWIFFTLIGSLWASAVDSDKEVTLLYHDETADEPLRMKVKVNREGLISYHMPGGDRMVDVETLEDYATGYAASRDTEEEACYIHQLALDMDGALRSLEESSTSGPQQYGGTQNLAAEPAEDDLKEAVGDRLLAFCGDYPIYKLREPEEGDEEAEEPVEENTLRLFFRFRRCRFFTFFIFRCYFINAAVTTGSSSYGCFKPGYYHG